MTLLPEVQLSTDEQKASYGFGLQFGEQLRRNDFDGLELEAVLAGIQHWYAHQQAALSDDQINPSFQLIKSRQQEKQAEVSRKREALAEQFLTANAARSEVLVFLSKSGTLQIKHLMVKEATPDRPFRGARK